MLERRARARRGGAAAGRPDSNCAAFALL